MNEQPPSIPDWTLTDRLVKCRTTAGLTQPAMADELGLSVRQIVRYEKGEHAPSRATVRAWAQITNVELPWLLGETPGGTEIVKLERRKPKPTPRRGGSDVVTHLPTDRHARDYGLAGRAFHQVAA